MCDVSADRRAWHDGEPTESEARGRGAEPRSAAPDRLHGVCPPNRDVTFLPFRWGHCGCRLRLAGRLAAVAADGGNDELRAGEFDFVTEKLMLLPPGASFVHRLTASEIRRKQDAGRGMPR
jgi:hypothetical protein